MASATSVEFRLVFQGPHRARQAGLEGRQVRPDSRRRQRIHSPSRPQVEPQTGIQTMKFNRLGQTGLFVSELCFGTWGFSGRNYFGGAIGTLSQKEATAFIGRALEARINFIDTANVYSFGDSELMTGQALKDLGVKRSD